MQEDTYTLQSCIRWSVPLRQLEEGSLAEAKRD
jgi:hypothetical protein